jgi:serine/threonine protein kinase
LPLDRYQNVEFAINEVELFKKKLKGVRMIVQFIDAFMHDNIFWMVIEMIFGRTFEDIDANYMTKKTLLSVIFHHLHLQKKFHALGVCHNDFSESNIMITSNRRFKVIDFGMGKQIASHENGFRFTTLSHCRQRDAEKLWKLVTRTIGNLWD